MAYDDFFDRQKMSDNRLDRGTALLSTFLKLTVFFEHEINIDFRY